MGDLAQEFGFYGESWDPAKYGDAYVMGEAGEGEPHSRPMSSTAFYFVQDV
jgi:hypothetical protein